MLQPIFDFVEKLSTDFSWKRIASVLGIIIVLAFMLFLYEALTGTNQLSKYERAVSIIQKIETIKQTTPESQQVVENIYEGLSQMTANDPGAMIFTLSLSTAWKQVIVAAIPCFLFTIAYIPGYIRNDEGSGNIVAGALLITSLLGFIGYFIPVDLISWLHYSVIPIALNVLIFGTLMWYGNRPDRETVENN